jgi:hypothetical protein
MATPDWRIFPRLERKRVTICIAAACSTEDGPRIVVCSDHKVSNYLGSNETGFKQRLIKIGWLCLLAGELTAARDLHFLLKKHFATVEKIDETNVKVLVEAAVNQRKRELTNQYVQGEFAIPYDENSIEQPRIKSRQSNAPTPFRIYPP